MASARLRPHFTASTRFSYREICLLLRTTSRFMALDLIAHSAT